MKEIVLRFIYEAIDETNEMLDEDHQIVKHLDTKLYGSGSHLDSIELVNLIVSVEQKIEEFYQKEITLADERIMQMNQNPFSTIARFVDYVETIIAENK